MRSSRPERTKFPRFGRGLAGLTVAGCLAVAAALPARATLLVNGDLDDPAIHESDLATGWTLLEGPDSIDADTGLPFPGNQIPADRITQGAKVLLGGLLDSGEISDPHERWFLSQRLHELEARNADGGVQAGSAASADDPANE